MLRRPRATTQPSPMATRSSSRLPGTATTTRPSTRTSVSSNALQAATSPTTTSTAIAQQAKPVRIARRDTTTALPQAASSTVIPVTPSTALSQRARGTPRVPTTVLLAPEASSTAVLEPDVTTSSITIPPLPSTTTSKQAKPVRIARRDTTTALPQAASSTVIPVTPSTALSRQIKAPRGNPSTASLALDSSASAVLQQPAATAAAVVTSPVVDREDFPQLLESSDEDDEDMSEEEEADAPATGDTPSSSTPRPHRSRSKRSPKPRASPPNRSPFLKYFDPCSDPIRLQCNLCPALPPRLVRYVYGKKKVTTSLQNHMAVHPDELAEILKTEYRYTQARSHLLRAAATGAIPFTISNNPELREFARCLDPCFVLPDAKTLSTTVLDSEFESAYSTVFNAVSMQDVSLTFDHWSSKDSVHSLMGSTANTIDSQWNRQLFIISLDRVDGSHNGDQVRDYLHNLQREYRFRSITTCITDNATVMTSGVSRAQLPRLGCVLHASHLMVCESLAGFAAGKAIVDTVRRIAVHLHRSKASWDSLKETLEVNSCIDMRKMPLEVKIRWGSTMRMLRVANNQMEYLGDTCRQAKVAPLKFEDKLLLGRLVVFLIEVDKFCSVMSTHQATLSSMIPYIKGLEETIEELKDSALKELYPLFKAQFLKRIAVYRQHNVVRHAYLLDPRFMHLGFLDDVTRSSDLEELFKQADAEFAEGGDVEPPVKKTRSTLLSEALPHSNFFGPSHARKEYDLLFDLALRTDLPEDVDPCIFWKEHCQKFPRLAPIARRLLAIPPSSIDSERLFSAVGIISGNSRRSRISSETLKKLIFIGAFCKKTNLRFKDTKDFDEFFDDLLDSGEEELEMRDEKEDVSDQPSTSAHLP